MKRHRRKRPVADRFWERVYKAEDSHWYWTGAVDAGGYSMFKHVAADGTVRERGHQWAYVDAKGEIPVGLTIDHLCRIRSCVRAAHLEAVTQAENNRRARHFMTTCKGGHEYSERNTRIGRNGCRVCRACQAIYSARNRKKAVM